MTWFFLLHHHFLKILTRHCFPIKNFCHRSRHSGKNKILKVISEIGFKGISKYSWTIDHPAEGVDTLFHSR